MKHIFKLPLSFVASFALLTACNESESFKAVAKTKVSAMPAEANAEPAAPQPAPVVTPPESPPAKASAIEYTTVVDAVKPEEKVVVGICREKLAYDPSEILCALQEETTNTVWKNRKMWNTLWLQNKKASWISPLASMKSGNMDYCPFVPGADKSIYVSHFTIDADQEVSFEAEIDDIGQVRLWKNADSTKEVYISARSYKASGKVKLEKGFYTVVIDATDTGEFASGSIATFFDPQGKIIRQTESSKDWCIYRVNAATDVADFLNSAAACKSCMIGDEAAAASASH